MCSYLKLARDYQQTFPFKSEIYSRFEAWLDMLSLANYKHKPWTYNGVEILIERGSFISTQRGLAKRWGWSRGGVIKFISALKKEGFLGEKTEKSGIHPQDPPRDPPRDPGYTIFTILNYDSFQVFIETASQGNLSEGSTLGSTLGSTPGILTNNINKVLLEALPPVALVLDPKDNNIYNNNIYNNNINNNIYLNKLIPKDNYRDSIRDNNTPTPPVVNDLAPVIPEELKPWIEYRREIKKPLKTASIALILKKYGGRLGDLRADVEHSILAGYQGLYAAPKKRPTFKSSSTSNNENNLRYMENTNGKQIDFANLANAYVLDEEAPDPRPNDGTKLVAGPGGHKRPGGQDCF